MAVVQSSVGNQPGLEAGTVSDLGSSRTVITKTAEGVVTPGRAVVFGTSADQVAQFNADDNFQGVALLKRHGEPGSTYVNDEPVAVLRTGVVMLTVAGAASPGDPVYVADDGTFTVVATDNVATNGVCLGGGTGATIPVEFA